jgi:hypothetical protein
LSQPLPPFLFQRARRTMPVTVKSDSGLAEGEIWFVEGSEVTFFCVEKLEAASRYEMRADVKTIGRNVDLLAEVVEVMHGRDAGHPGGYLHRGEFIALDPDDEQRFLRRFWQLNPEHAPPELEQAPPRRPSAPAAPPRSPERSSRSKAAPRPSSRGASPPSTAPTSAAPVSRSPGSTSSTQGRRGRDGQPRAPTPGERRRLRQQARTVEGIPEPPLARDERVVADVAPGEPPSAMVQYSHREIMQADVLLRGEDIWFFVGCHPLLWEGQDLTLYVQLPAGHVVQVRGRVVATRKQHCVIESRRLHASLQANLRAALGL